MNTDHMRYVHCVCSHCAELTQHRPYLVQRQGTPVPSSRPGCVCTQHPSGETHSYICTHARTHACTHTYTYTYIHTHTHIYRYIQTHMHKQMDILTYTHTHTHMFGKVGDLIPHQSILLQRLEIQQQHTFTADLRWLSTDND